MNVRGAKLFRAVLQAANETQTYSGDQLRRRAGPEMATGSLYVTCRHRYRRTPRGTAYLRVLEIDLPVRLCRALVNGQTRERGSRPSGLTSTAPHPSSARMARAHLTAHQLYRQMSQAVLAGQPERAIELAEQANAADYAYRLHERAYRRERHEAIWQHAERFYIELESPQPQAETRYHSVFTFRLQALWNEELGRWEVENAAEIELWSGIEVGEDGWRELMGLLVYLRDQVVNGETLSKPGMKADPLYLIYRRNGEFLSPHPYIQKRYPRSLFALEALRRTLEYDNRASTEPRQPLEWLTPQHLTLCSEHHPRRDSA